MTGTVTVYFRTNFNGVDIPATPSVLTDANYSVFPDVYFTREDIDLKTLDIRANYSALRDADYLSLQTEYGTCYYFCIPRAKAQGMTTMELELDALTTMGGASNLEYISGWQERGHITQAEDVLFGNVASEAWVPSQPLENVHMQKLIPQTSATSDLDIVLSNINLYTLGQNGTLTIDVIKGIVSGETDPKMYLPSIDTIDPSESTKFYVHDFIDDDEKNYCVTGSGAFNYNDQVTPLGIQKLFSCGQLQLQASYTIPKEYLGNYGTAAGIITNIHGIHGSIGVTNAPFQYTISNYTPKNKKCYATYRTYTIANLASGDMCIKEPEQLYDGTITYPSVNIWADPSSTGKPYARFNFIKTNPLQYVDCVRGLQWCNNQLLLEGASGSMWNSINTAFSNQQLQRSMDMNLLNQSYTYEQGAISANQAGLNYKNNVMLDTVSTAGGIISAGSSENPFMSSLKSVGSALAYDQRQTLNYNTLQNNLQSMDLTMKQQQAQTDFANRNLQQAVNENNIGLLKNNKIVSPTPMFTPEINLAMYGYNYFVLYETRKSDDDLKSEDMYYQRYGYNGLHRPLTQASFNARQYYNYVQAFDVNLKHPTLEFGMRIRNAAIAQLNAGVRTWKVLPDASYYDIN